MRQGCEQFSHDISGWRIKKLQQFSYMFAGTDYPHSLVGWETMIEIPQNTLFAGQHNRYLTFAEHQSKASSLILRKNTGIFDDLIDKDKKKRKAL